jgi:Zn-dependent alcohol dehydrogenase
MPVHHFFGISGWAERVVVHERSAIRITADLAPEVACLLGCGVSTGLGAVVHSDAGAGTAVAVFGCGGVGLAAIMAARLVGALAIIAVDLNQDRLRIAAEVGATATFQADDPDLPRRIRRETGGGADLAVDTVGGPVSTTAVRACRPGGTLAVIGTADGPLDLNDLQPGKRIVSSVAGGVVPGVDIPAWAELAAQGPLPLDRLVSRQRPLAEADLALKELSASIGIRTVLIPPR